MIIKGSLNLTTDINQIFNMRLSCRIITLGEVDPNTVIQLAAISGSIFMPSYATISHEIDGDKEGFILEYYKQFQTKDSQETLAVILKALSMGTNIALYMTPEEYQLYGALLSSFILNDFGIVIGTPNNPFMMDQNPIYQAKIISLLYISGFATSNDLLLAHPVEVPLAEAIIYLLIDELCPVIEDENNLQAYAEYFQRLMISCKKSGNLKSRLMHRVK